MTSRTPDEIWKGDLFGRREEASRLISYIESVVGRLELREDRKAYTIAVDAGYGVGKTFFLKRLAEALKIDHPVAFVDAWADDLSDEPLTALVATLHRALAPLKDDESTEKLSRFMEKSGEVAKVVAIGLFRRLLQAALTAKGVDALDGVVTGVSEAVHDAMDDSIGEMASGAVDDAAKSVSANGLMDERVATFERGRRAVTDMKNSLRAIVEGLTSKSKHAPIVIVIDELDRCRPTYAIKLLEEIKHLFDVPGLVFILGMHVEQLSHSVSGAYGSAFDGSSYLRRFIDRRVLLSYPDLTTLIRKVFAEYGIDKQKFRFPQIIFPSGKTSDDIVDLVSLFMKAHDLAARDVFALADLLQTSIAIADIERLSAVYLIPLAIAHVKGLPSGSVDPDRHQYYEWKFEDPRANMIARQPIEPKYLISEFKRMSNMDVDSLRNQIDSPAYLSVVKGIEWIAANKPFWAPQNYPQLLQAAGRFVNPQIPTAGEGR